MTADIGMRLLVSVPDHETAGKLMDSVRAAVGVVLGHHGLTGRLEFVHFNTPPCKAARLDGHARDVPDEDVRLGAGHEASARGNPATDDANQRA
ncbi:hypothetical protein [Solirubrobacter ginsenosidimutans]|nr:hypothetical protein [Solirubrobacter ginsenosidimutans]